MQATRHLQKHWPLDLKTTIKKFLLGHLTQDSSFNLEASVKHCLSSKILLSVLVLIMGSILIYMRYVPSWNLLRGTVRAVSWLRTTANLHTGPGGTPNLNLPRKKHEVGGREVDALIILDAEATIVPANEGLVFPEVCGLNQDSMHKLGARGNFTGSPVRNEKN
ncbi:hypothetical protein VNO77_34512 [Canavalia gladiata]|uniref:Uncharacterized protein n=1 Tax=Canavalia gladiata TaxID=3824 RepID=A0AAN9KED3_CANGL